MWRDLAERVCADPGPCLLWGAPDTGKTTLAAFLASFCHDRDVPAAVVDADVGQSDIGPPGTVAMALVDRIAASTQQLPMRSGYFVGSISPAGSEMILAMGTHLMVREARGAGAEMIIVDTTGAITEPGGRRLKYLKFELLRPKYVLVLQRRDEMRHMLGTVRGRRGTRVIELPVLPGVRRRSRSERRHLRQQRFSRHFSGAVRRQFSLERLRLGRTLLGTGYRLCDGIRERFSGVLGGRVLHAERVPEGLFLVVAEGCDLRRTRDLKEVGGAGRAIVVHERELRNLLVGLIDGRGDFLGAGILEGVDFECNRATVLASADAVQRVGEISLGKLRVTPEGRELGFSRAVTYL